MSQAICRFPGIPATYGWSMTLGGGIFPSTCVITTLLGYDNTPRSGTLVLEQDGREISFPDSRVDSRTLSAGGSGKFIKVAIHDRRWRWQFSKISGNYNFRGVKKNGKPIRQKSIRELAALLFVAMGETGFDVGNLPGHDFLRPYMDWQGIHAAPVLSSLCASVGCFVTYDPLTNKAGVASIGEGRSLPSGGRVINRSAAISSEPTPDQVRYLAPSTLLQRSFKLEPVGIDTDGVVKPIAELSYTPSLGWGSVDPFKMLKITGTYDKDGQTLKLRDLALSSVLRMYRIAAKEDGEAGPYGVAYKVTGSDGYAVEEFVQDIKQILPLRDKKIEKTTDENGNEEDAAYSIEGVYAKPEEDILYDGILDFEEDRTMPDAVHSLDRDRGIVMFREATFLWGDNYAIEGARLRLTTSFRVCKDGVFLRHEEYRNTKLGKLGTGPKIIRSKDEGLRIILDEDGYPTEENEDEITDLANFYVEQFAKTLDAEKGQGRTYSRLVHWKIDGITRQITWSGGAGRPGITVISQNEEHNPYRLNFKQSVKRAEQDRREELQAIEETEAG